METVGLNNATDQVYLTDIYGTFYLTTTEYICFSSADRTFSRMDHILGHRTSSENSRTLKSY